MSRIRIFISSVQKEFAQEREILRDYLRENPLARRFFNVFLFEDVPALDRRPDDLYLDEVQKSELYVGLFGDAYGTEDEDGISPTEREFDQATDSGVHRLVFVKGINDNERHPKMQALIRKAQAGLIRKRFNTSEELVTALDEALVEYLDGKDLVRSEPFDASPCSNASLDDLDVDRMRWFIDTARDARGFPLTKDASTEKLLVHLDLLNDGKLTNAAMLLFGKSPQRFLISSEVRCAHFHGTEVAKPIPSYQVYKGTAFQLVNQTVDFVLSKIALSVGTRAKRVRASVTYEIPKEVVTEAIVNAVAHRDYTSNASIQVMIFADRIEIWNPGGLPPPLTLEQLRVDHSSHPNNPLLAESLYLAQYIERMGTGISDMIRLCGESGLPEPEFTISSGFKVTIWRSALTERIKVQSELLSAGDLKSRVLSLFTNESTPKSELSKKLRHLEATVANASYQYNKNYRERHGQVKVFCAGIREPIPLDDVYVNIQFLDQYIASRYRSSEEVEQAFRERNRQSFYSTSAERQEGIQVANNEQYLMLLGGPGAGKSTFLRKVGLEALKGKQGNFTHKCIPVFLELKRFTEDQIDIEALITQEFEICGYPYPDQMTNTALKSGKLLVLFDGLDEVPTVNVNNVIRKIGDFVDQYSQNRFIASCRIAAYRGGFTEVEIADFDDVQIQTYIKNWFDSTPDGHWRQFDEEMQTAKRCWETLNASEHQATKELARNSLLLTLLCVVYDGEQNFPRNRASLYDKLLNVFLEEWAAEKRVYRGTSISQYLDIVDEKRMLSEIAAKNFAANRLFVGENELIAQIQEFGEKNANTLKTFNASKILDTILIDQGVLVERVRGLYSFSHLTFQEYLTANYIAGDIGSIRDLVNQHLHDQQWHKVFLLTAGLVREAADLLVAMEVEASKSINTARLKSLFGWAKRITDTADGRYSGRAKRAFAIRQFFLINLLNKVHETVKYKTKQSQDQNFDLYFDLYQEQDRDLYQDRDIYLDLDQDLYFDLYQEQDQDLHQDRDLYLDKVRYFSPNLRLYYDFYRYMDADFHSSDFSKSEDRFDKELSERIKVVKRTKETKIFKSMDLDRMVQRFNEEREFIKAVGNGESVEPPAESIHDTWLSVLQITDDMLAISRQEIESCTQYLRAADLIVACKEAAGRVPPEVWQKIEERLLA